MIDTKKNRGNLYLYLQERDILGKIGILLHSKNFRLGSDGKWRRPYAAMWDTPWIHQYNDGGQECEIWHNVFFPKYKWVPTYCKNCWKVVVMPRTVVELFDLYELQKELEHQCKCGIELRATDNRRYGGYFYNWGQEEGQKCYEKVRKAVSKQISPEVGVVLKCSCTEYEIDCGPPNDWVASKEQLFIEDAMRRYVVQATENFRQDDNMRIYVMLKWIHHAAMTSDPTYKEFTSGKDITFNPKTYHVDWTTFNNKKERKNGKMAK